MTPLLFQPKSHLEPAFSCAINAGRFERHLNVFRWDDRLVAHEEVSGMWWGTLDAWKGQDAREFWHGCVDNERVGRLFSHRRGFQLPKGDGSTLSMGKRLFHVLVAKDNSGFARIDDRAVWHPFPAVEPWKVRNPLTYRPTIWSRGFRTKFALRGGLEAVALDAIPETLRAIWWQGAGAWPLRLARTAGVLGWADKVGGKMTLQQFWQEVLRGRFRTSPTSSQQQTPKSLPTTLLQSSEVALPGEITRSMGRMWNSPLRPLRSFNETAVFVWHDADVTLQVGLRIEDDSAHEQIESRLELRDWLAQFYPPSEVESWFNA